MDNKKIISESHMGKTFHFYVKNHSKEVITKISETKKGVQSKKKGVKYV